MLTHAVARRVYPGEVGAGDMAADVAALREWIVKVKHSRLALVTLWHEAVAATEDATHRRSLSQRRAVDLEAKKFKDIARAQAFAEQASHRRAVHALMSGSPADMRDPAVLAAVRALHPDAERPALRAPLEDLPPAPTITMTALKKAVRKMDVCAAAGPDGMPVLHVSGLMQSTAGDGGVEKGAKALLAFMKVCANGNLTPCVARCFGTAKHVSILKNAAIGVAGGLWPLAVGTVLRRLASILVLHKALLFAAEYLLPHQVSTVAVAGSDILVHVFREKLEQFGYDPDKSSLRVDAANAFNAVSRAEILERVCEHAPPAARFFHAICGGKPYMVAGRTLLLSRQGTQQGGSFGDAALCSGYTTSHPPFSVRM
jgi:hypothetical protein